MWRKEYETGHLGRWLTAGAFGVALIVAAGSAQAESGSEWTIYGGDYANTRYSSLDQITTENVGTLRAAWIRSLGSSESQEATPLVINGTMYIPTSSGPASVFALNAKTGVVKWRYEPELPDDYKATVCCGLANRGVAYANGRIFVGRLDAILVALDAKTGEELWSVPVQEYAKGYSLTSPPTTVKDLVITGFSGGEFGVRGALQAYKQDTGELVWKTYTIPGTGEPGNETWKGDSWKTGGGTIWYVGSYDAELNLIYYGTSNAAPWGGQTRGHDSSDIGEYTNKHSASQLAFDVDTGEIVWSYQMTPSDVWDYDGVNEGILADLKIGNSTVPTLLKADRNGFFYVMNRKSGELVSARHYVLTNWASHVDKGSGMPVEDEAYRPQLDKWARNVCPNLIGGKNWQPMSYSKQTGLIYMPTFNMCMDIANRDQEFKEGNFFLASEFDLAIAGPGDNLGEFVAYDPITGEKAWGIKEDLPFLGGAMTTAGGLVFYGNPAGDLKAVNARTGEILWNFPVGTGITQSPVTYLADGKQYIAVVAGRLVGPPSFFGEIGQRVIDASPTGGVVVAFELPN
jgi:alcohol dehydrogenase (cytochrome c)/methanol dehydrogenase (cytochrome c) subunit 1